MRLAGSATHFSVGIVFDEQVPFVHDEDARLVLLGDVIAKLLVDFADPLRGVEEQQHDVGPADAALGPVGAVEIDVGLPALGFADARRVDGDERLAVELEPHVDAVARGAGHFADDHPLVR